MRSLFKNARALGGPAGGLVLTFLLTGSAIAQGAAPSPVAAPDASGQPAAAPAAAPAPPPPLAERVVASVNDDIISTYDLDQRIRLLIVTAGIQPTNDNLPELEREALSSLIDERLELQELAREEKEQKFSIIATDADIDDE